MTTGEEFFEDDEVRRNVDNVQEMSWDSDSSYTDALDKHVVSAISSAIKNHDRSPEDLAFLVRQLESSRRTDVLIALKKADEELWGSIVDRMNPNPPKLTWVTDELRTIHIPGIVAAWSTNKLGSTIEVNDEEFLLLSGPDPILVQRLSDKKEFYVR